MTVNEDLEVHYCKDVNVEDPLLVATLQPTLVSPIITEIELHEQEVTRELRSSPKRTQASTNKKSFISSPICKQFAITLCVSLLHIAAGVGFGYTGIILPSITAPKSGHFYMSTTQVSVYTSMISMGSLFGSLLAGPLANNIGQRNFMLMIIPLGVSGWLITYFSNLFSYHLLSRFILGMFCTAACSASTSYIAETVDSDFRGRFLAMTDLARQIGILFICLVGSTTLNWRVVLMVCGLSPLLVPAMVLFLLPQSPRWLIVRKKPEEDSRQALLFYRGKWADIGQEIKEIQLDVGDSGKTASFRHQLRLLKEKSLLKRFVILAYLNFGFNLTGNYAFVGYTVMIFKAAKTGLNPYTSTVLCAVVRVVGSLLYVILSDRVGRRPLSLIFFLLCGISTTTFGVYFYLSLLGYDTSSLFWIPLASMLTYQLFANICMPVVRLLRNELMPNNVRNLGSNLLYFFTSIGCFIAAISYPLMVESIGLHWTFWFYSINTIVIVFVIYFFLPETRGKTLEEISKLF